MKNTAVFLILILCVTGCSGGYSEALSAVERQMQSEARPERAYEMLCSIPEGSLRSKDDRALYGLLLTELLIKTRRPVESDSLIDASIRHFWHSGDRQHLADGYIYKCRLEYNKKNYHEAMESALMAIHISEDIADTLRMARSNDFMADIYNKVFNYFKSISIFNFNSSSNILLKDFFDYILSICSSICHTIKLNRTWKSTIYNIRT